jgi:hypothetical protein
MDVSIVAHQWGSTLTGWLGAASLAAGGIVLGLVLGVWWGRPPRR